MFEYNKNGFILLQTYFNMVDSSGDRQISFEEYTTAMNNIPKQKHRWGSLSGIMLYISIFIRTIFIHIIVK